MTTDQLLHDSDATIEQAGDGTENYLQGHEFYVLERLLYSIACSLLVLARDAAKPRSS